MQGNVKTLDKIGLYIISLWLLFFLIILLKLDIPICFKNWEFIGFKELFSRNVLPSISLIPLIIGLAYYQCFNYRAKGAKPLQMKVISVKNKNYEHLTFLTTYIVPLICFDLSSTRYTMTLLALLIIIGAIYVKTDLFFANPTLALLGFHIYEVNMESKLNGKNYEIENAIVIGKISIQKNEEVRLMELDNKIYYGSKVQWIYLSLKQT